MRYLLIILLVSFSLPGCNKDKPAKQSLSGENIIAAQKLEEARRIQLEGRRQELLKEYENLRLYNQFPCIQRELPLFTEGCNQDGVKEKPQDNKGETPYIVVDIIPKDMREGCVVLELEGSGKKYITTYHDGPNPAASLDDFMSDDNFLSEDYEDFKIEFEDDGIAHGFTKNNYWGSNFEKKRQRKKQPVALTFTPKELFSLYEKLPGEDKQYSFYKKYKNKKIRIKDAKILKVYKPYCGSFYITLTSDGETKQISAEGDLPAQNLEEGQDLTINCFADYAYDAPNPVVKECEIIN